MNFGGHDPSRLSHQTAPNEVVAGRTRASAAYLVLVFIAISIPFGYVVCEIIGLAQGIASTVIICALVTHSIFRSHKQNLYKNDIKLLDYLVVAAAILGISGISDLQKKLDDLEIEGLREEITSTQSHIEELEKTRASTFCYAKKGEENLIVLQRSECVWVNRAITDSDMALRQMAKNLSERKTRFFFDNPTIKTLGYIFIAIGIALRITKTSAEFFEWHKK